MDRGCARSIVSETAKRPVQGGMPPLRRAHCDGRLRGAAERTCSFAAVGACRGSGERGRGRARLPPMRRGIGASCLLAFRRRCPGQRRPPATAVIVRLRGIGRCLQLPPTTPRSAAAHGHMQQQARSPSGRNAPSSPNTAGADAACADALPADQSLRCCEKHASAGSCCRRPLASVSVGC